MKCLRILLATFTTVLFTVLFVPSLAKAQSAYDNFLNRSNIVTLNGNNQCNVNVAPNWSTIMREHYPHMDENWEDVIDNGAWALSIDTGNASYGDIIGVNYVLDKTKYEVKVFGSPSSNDAGFRIYNKTTGQTATSTSQGVYSATLIVNSQCEPAPLSVGFSGGILNYRKGSIHKLANIFSTFETVYPIDYDGEDFNDSYTFPTPTPVWLNYAVKIIDGKKMTIHSENWTNYRDKHGGGIRYGDVGGTSDITLCRIEDKDNTGCVDTLAFVENKSGPIALEYPKAMIGQTGYYKVFIDNTNKEPKIPPFDAVDYPFDVKNRSIIVFNDGTSTVALDTIGYYEDDAYFPQYDDNVYYNKFMNHNLIDDHGLLNVVLAPLGYLSELPKVTCKPLNLPMPSRFGQDINLPCMTESVYQPQFPQIFQIYQLLITAIFSYMVGLRIFQNIKEMSSEKDDSIEVVKL